MDNQLPKKSLTPEFDRAVKDNREDKQDKKRVKQEIQAARKTKFNHKG